MREQFSILPLLFFRKNRTIVAYYLKKWRMLAMDNNSPLKGIFGKLERPKYPDLYPVVDNDDNKSIKSNKPIYYFIIYILTILIFTLILPHDVLDVIAPLKYFINSMAFIFPSVAAFNNYSKFPQIAQLVYVFCIATMPLQAYLMYNISKDEWFNPQKQTQDELRIMLCLFLPLLIMALIIALFLFPMFARPDSPKFLLRYYHTSKIVFSIVTAIVFFVNIMTMTVIIICAQKLKKKILK